MTSYPFIIDLFTNILTESNAIGGRFYQCITGFEINSDEMAQVINDVVAKPNGQKYPLAMLMPPRSRGTFTGKFDGWEHYRFIMFFLKTTYANSENQVATRNPNTGTSRHSVPMDWHDMKRAAVAFVKVLDTVQRANCLHNTSFRLDHDDKMIDPVSMIGKDKLSGVRLEFNGSLFTGCDLEDYDINDVNSITIPDNDSHPEHKL